VPLKCSYHGSVSSIHKANSAENLQPVLTEIQKEESLKKLMIEIECQTEVPSFIVFNTYEPVVFELPVDSEYSIYIELPNTNNMPKLPKYRKFEHNRDWMLTPLYQTI